MGLYLSGDEWATIAEALLFTQKELVQLAKQSPAATMADTLTTYAGQCADVQNKIRAHHAGLKRSRQP